MNRIFLSGLFLFLVSVSPFRASSQTRWSFELQFGVVHSLKLPLTFYQKNYPDIRVSKADFYSEPLNDPPYWDWRFTKWFKNRSIQFEAIHHKFYLKNLPAEVDRFGISHGYNMVMFNYGTLFRKYIFSAGAGSAFVHGESTVRGKVYPEGPGFDIYGYRLRGLSINLAAARQVKINKTFFVNAELKVNAAVANIPIVDGHARVNIVVFQFIMGPGFNWAVREETK